MRYIKELIIFIFIFSIYNDTYFVGLFGENAIKLLMIAFVGINVFNFRSYIFKLNKSITMNRFYLFLVSVLVSTLVTTILYGRDDVFSNILLLIAVFAVFVFFSNYNYEKAIIYAWISMIYSVIICYFSEPLSEWTFRKTGGTGDANEFATELVLFLFMGIFLYRKYQNFMIFIITLPVFLYGILIAGSMSSFIALAIIAVIFFLVNLNPNNIIRYVPLFAFIGLTILLSSNYIRDNELILNVLNRGDDLHTADQRFESWKAGFKMIQDYILFGVGQSSFGEMAPKYLEVQVDQGLLWSHNIFIQLFSGSGIISFTLFIIFLWQLFVSEYKANLNKINTYIFFGVVGVMVMSGTLGLLYKKFFWFAIALLNNMQDKGKK